VLDVRVLGFNLAATLLAVALFGIAPAWFSMRASLRSGRVMSAWVVAQVALSLALVVNGALVLGSMRRILAIEPGYRAASVLITSMDLSLAAFTPERGTQFFASLIERVGQLPGVRSATIAKSSPAVDWSDRVEVTGGWSADMNIVAPGYFQTLGVPLLAGRDFAAADRPSAAIVSKSLADRMWPGGNALGQRLTAGTRTLEVVGVAADTRYRTVLEAPPALIYIPLFQNYDSIGRLMVDAAGDPAAMKETLRRVVQQANPELPVRGVATLQEQIDDSLWQRNAAATLLTLFGVFAIVLACAGIYGVVSYATAQQTRDIAIRMAIGAERIDVLRQVLARTIRLAAAGIAIGAPLAFWAKPALAGMLYAATGTETVTFAGAALLFVLVAALAAAVPARRAATIDPALALRAE
jgi:predicted permease